MRIVIPMVLEVDAATTNEKEAVQWALRWAILLHDLMPEADERLKREWGVRWSGMLVQGRDAFRLPAGRSVVEEADADFTLK